MTPEHLPSTLKQKVQKKHCDTSAVSPAFKRLTNLYINHLSWKSIR